MLLFNIIFFVCLLVCLPIQAILKCMGAIKFLYIFILFSLNYVKVFCSYKDNIHIYIHY